MAISHLSNLILLLLLVHQTAAQAVSPNPVFDCTSPSIQVVYTACSAGDYSRCCPVGASCCAGGCCDLVSNCLNVGNSTEICCPVSDPNFCGYYGGSGTTPPDAVQSIVCTGSSGLSSYFCPPGAKCNSAKDSCIGGSSVGGGGSTMSSAAKTSLATGSMSISAWGESISLEASNTVTVVSSTTAQTDMSTASGTTNPSTTDQVATATATSSSSGQARAASHNDVTGSSVDVVGVWVMVQLLFAGIL